MTAVRFQRTEVRGRSTDYRKQTTDDKRQKADRRRPRSVAINIREGFAKRRYENVFIRHLNDSIGSSEETRGWLDFSFRCRYINQGTYQRLDKLYDEVSAMLYSLMKNWKTLN